MESPVNLSAPLTLDLFPPLPDSRLPALSIVVAARDEEEATEAALRSLLELDYPDWEVIFVDDRSSDATADIAERLQASHPQGFRLQVIRNRHLPEGWLGKVHALHLGVQRSRHPLLLLTDADVRFRPEALRRAVTAQQVLAADHLAVAPGFELRGFWEPALVTYFLLAFSLRYRPWAVHRDRKRYVGVGAFNLLTRETLMAVERLEPLRLQVVDDLQLGRMVKARGRRQFAILGHHGLEVRWFQGLSGLVHGLEKNAYAGLDYRPEMALATSLAAAAPCWSLVLIAGLFSPAWAALGYAVQMAIGALVARASGGRPWSGALLPLAGLVLAFTILRSAWLAERRQAIVWRQTRYPLPDLRRALREFNRREALPQGSAATPSS